MEKKTQQNLEMLQFVENENRSEIGTQQYVVFREELSSMFSYIVVHSPQKQRSSAASELRLEKCCSVDTNREFPLRKDVIACPTMRVSLSAFQWGESRCNRSCSFSPRRRSHQLWTMSLAIRRLLLREAHDEPCYSDSAHPLDSWHLTGLLAKHLTTSWNLFLTFCSFPLSVSYFLSVFVSFQVLYQLP